MNNNDSKQFMKKFPNEENILKSILKAHLTTYESTNWELRLVQLPNVNVMGGTQKIHKLYINDEFIINILPLTEDLLKTIKERYQVMDNQLITEVKNLRVELSRIIQTIKPSIIDYTSFPFTQTAVKLIEARYWLGKTLAALGAEYPYPQGSDATTQAIDNECDVFDMSNTPLYHIENDIFAIKELRKQLQRLADIPVNGPEHNRAKTYILEAKGWLGMALGKSVHGFWQAPEPKLVQDYDASLGKEKIQDIDVQQQEFNDLASLGEPRMTRGIPNEHFIEHEVRMEQPVNQAIKPANEANTNEG